MAQNSPQRNNQSGNLSEQSVKDFLELQKEELKLRQQENEIRKIQLQQNYELSKEGLKQQGEYIKSSPKHAFNNRVLLAAFLTVVLLIVSGVLLYCVHLGKEEIALRILELVATAIISGGGGYAWGKSRAKNNDKNKVELVEE